jgi:trimethylamine-N-oxide reductase (cytochrome c)
MKSSGKKSTACLGYGRLGKRSSGFINFYKDPEANPLRTPSGKLEIYSDSLAEILPDDPERRPYPQYIASGESHQEDLKSERAKKYPYLIVSNHPKWRVHANMDDISWFREILTCKVVGPEGINMNRFGLIRLMP